VTRPPHPLPRLYRWRTNLLQAPLFFLWTSACGTLSLLVSLIEKNGRIQHHIARLWARGGIFLSGSRLTICGAENLRKHPVAVYAANHTSYMDTPVIFAALPFQFRILAKKELWPIPFIGWHLNRSGQIPIDTVNTHATLSSLGAGVRALRAGMPSSSFPRAHAPPPAICKPSSPAQPSSPSVPRYARPHRPQRCLRPLTHPRASLLSLPAHPHRWRTHLHEGMTIRQADELTARLRTTIDAMRTPAMRESLSPSSLS